MKNLSILLLVVFSCAAISFGQNAKTLAIRSETLTELPAELKEFIPAGYSFLSGEKGNLNLDKRADIVVVLKKDNEKETSDVIDHPEKRPLLIFLGQSDGSYKLAARNDNTVYCVDCGGIFGDPFESLTITNGNFSVNHYGGSNWRWTRIISYKYSPADKNWYLFKDGSESFHTSNPDKVITKIKTVKNFGKVSFDQFDIYKEEK